MSPDAGADPAPLVSVVIPVYNRAPLIGRAVASVLAQSYRHIELVIVDDASSDDLAGALAAITDPRLRVVTHPVNRGAAAARNTGVAEARGAFVAFLDSDDTWLSEKLERQVAAMDGQPREVAGTVCAYDCTKAGYRERRLVPAWTPRTFYQSQLFGCTCGPGTTLLCRRSIFSEIGPLDETLRRLEDWDWILRLAEKGYLLLPSPEVLARVEVGSSPSPRDVDAAIAVIRARRYAEAARRGITARRIFASTLHLERAAAAYGARAYARAGLALLLSLACYPPRGGEFCRRLLQRVAGPARRRGGGFASSRGD